MANRRALWINSGSLTQLATTDGLLAAELDVTSGNLLLGGTNASAILLGANLDKDAAEALVIGGTNASAIQFGANIDKDAAEALVIGGSNATAVQFGAPLDADAAEALVIGPTNATSVQFGTGIDKDAAESLTIGGTNATAILFGANIDKDAAEALIIGGTNATAIQFGANIDKDAAEALIIGGTNATAVQFGANIDKDAAEQFDIGVTNATAVRVQNIIIDAESIDTNGASVLEIGAANATEVRIGDVGVTTYIEGDLNVAGDETVTGSATFNGPTITFGDDPSDVVIFTASVDSDINFLGPQNLTTSTGDINLIAEGTNVAQGGLGIALTGTVAATNGNATVTGTGTAFTTELNIGDAIEIRESASSVTVYTVAGIASDTSLTLDSTYSNTGGSGFSAYTDDNIFEVVTGDLALRLQVNKSGGTTLTYGEADGPILTLANAQDAINAQVFLTPDEPPVMSAANGDLALTTTTGKLYWYGGAQWNEVGASTPTSLQGAYDQQTSGGASPVQLLTYDWEIQIDDSAANWVVSNEAGDADYIATNYTNNSLDLGSAAGKEVHFLGDVGTDIPFDGSARSITNDSTGSISITQTGTGAISIDSQGSTLTLDGNSGVNIVGNAAEVDITTSGALDMNAGAITVDGSSLTVGGAGALPTSFAATTFTASATSTMDLDAASALSINSSAAAINIGNDAVNQAINVGTAGVRTITIGSPSATEVQIDADLVDVNSDGAITVNSGTTTDIDAVGVLSLNSSGAAINVGNDAVSQAINVGTAGVRTITIGSPSATEVQIDADLVDVNSDGSVTINGGAASNFTTSAGAIVVDAEAAALTLDGNSGVNIASNNTEVDITTAGGALDINAGAITVDGTSLTTGGAGALPHTFGATTFDVNASGAVSIDGGAASNFSTSAGAITIDAQASTLTLDGNSGVNIVGNAAEVDITTSGALDMNAGAITVDGSSLTVGGAGALPTSFTSTTFAASASSTMDLDAAGALSINSSAGAINIGNDDIDQAINIGTTGERAITVGNDVGAGTVDIVAGATGDVTFDALGMTTPITLNEAGDLDLDGAFTATSIIGALNELKADSTNSIITYNAAVDVDFGEVVYMTTSKTIGLAESATNVRAVGISVSTGTITTGNPVNVATGGEVEVHPDVVGTPDEGKYVYLSATGGALTCTAPASGTVLRVGVLTDSTASAMKMVIQIGTPVTL